MSAIIGDLQYIRDRLEWSEKVYVSTGATAIQGAIIRQLIDVIEQQQRRIDALEGMISGDIAQSKLDVFNDAFGE